MAKFYVQSGSIRGIVDCYDSECAAIWAVNRVMVQIVPNQEDIDDEAEDRDDIGMFALDETIQVSERGFDRDDAESIDTHLAFVHWHQLKRAIEALEQKLNEND